MTVVIPLVLTHETAERRDEVCLILAISTTLASKMGKTILWLLFLIVKWRSEHATILCSFFHVCYCVNVWVLFDMS